MTPGAGFAWGPFLGSLHPVVLHVPVGLLAGAALVEAGSWAWREDGVRRVRRALYAVTALAALVAAGTGWLIASGGGYSGRTVEQHRWFAIGLAAALVALPVLDWFGREKRSLGAARVGVLFVALVLVTIAGYLGGSLTHGHGHLARHAPEWLRPVLGGAETPTTVLEGSDGEATAVFAVIEARCVECHGPGKEKSGLRLDRPDGLAGVVEPFDAAGSELFRRVTLPVGDADAMPPEGGALAGGEILSILRWINAGASIGSLETLARERAGIAADAAAAIDSVLNATGAIVIPVSGDAAGGLRVDFARREAPVTQTDIDALAPIAERIVELGFAGRDLAAVERWSGLGGLETVHLERSSVTDGQIAAIVAGSPLLGYINLHSTSVTDATLGVLADLPELRRVVLYETATTPAGISALRGARPRVLITTEEVLADD